MATCIKGAYMANDVYQNQATSYKACTHKTLCVRIDMAISIMSCAHWKAAEDIGMACKL